MNITEMLSTIDLTKMERDFVDLYDICESEFGIEDFLSQEYPLRLTYCYYNSWICTDTKVGIRVWYLDNIPVCISYKPYRKRNEYFSWLTKERYETTRQYILSLKEEDFDIVNIIDNDELNDVFEKFKSIEFKKFEEFNIIKE
jgi:hypothetical protein